jgi:hypothetical protein
MGKALGDVLPLAVAVAVFPVPVIAVVLVLGSAGAGFALSALNPKNLLLVAAAAADIAEVGLSGGQQAVVLVAFAPVLIMAVLFVLIGAKLIGDAISGLSA